MEFEVMVEVLTYDTVAGIINVISLILIIMVMVMICPKLPRQNEN
jgi:hypothetical protein